ncbi:MAG: universal stress protein [Planctomycetaceae bacterium]|nr:universal stress protein [Planctomycetaceae bacterium]
MKVLLATDGSAASREADWFLERLPFPEPTQLIIANVALVPALAQMRREFPQSVNEMLDQYHARAESLLVEEAARFEGINGTVETYPLAGHPADELVRFGEESHCDLIVLGARGMTPTQRFLLGSVSLKVAKHAPCSVLVTRPHQSGRLADQPLKIVICHDGSEASRQAVETMARFHWGEQVEITVLSVVTVIMHPGMAIYQKTGALWENEKRQANEALAWAVDHLRETTSHVNSEHRETESIDDEILSVIEELGADLVVLGHRGLSRIDRFFLGSTSENVLRHAPCSVWIVREKPEA